MTTADTILLLQACSQIIAAIAPLVAAALQGHRIAGIEKPRQSAETVVTLRYSQSASVSATARLSVAFHVLRS